MGMGLSGRQMRVSPVLPCLDLGCAVLQKVLSKGDWVLTKAAIPGTKSAIQSYFGYGGYPRRPLKRLSQDKVDAVAEGIREVMDVEKSL